MGMTPLRTGDIIEIHMVEPPDERYEQSVRSFLSPSKKIWMWHLNLSLRGELDELDSRYYLGFLKDRMISNVTTWEHGPIGIVGHLFTAEDYRNRGACTTLMRTVIHDFLSRDGKTLIGGFKPASRSVAEKLGFRSIMKHSEVMRYDSSPDFVQEYFQPGNMSCRDSTWKDWPGISFLFTVEQGWSLRSMKHKILGPYDYEDYFLEDMWQRTKSSCMSKVLATKKHRILGYATLTLTHRPEGDSWLLDFFVHPVAVSNVETLLNAFDWPEGKIECYVEAGCREKRDTLQAQDFEEKAALRRQVKAKTVELILMQLEGKVS
jgi:hypothetical protein